MDLKDIFYLSGDELRTLVHTYLVDKCVYADCLTGASRDDKGITEFGISIYPTWQKGDIVQPEGAVVLVTNSFFRQNSDFPLKTQVFVYIVEPNKYIGTHGLGEEGVQYFYESWTTEAQFKYIGTANLGDDEGKFFKPTHQSGLTYKAPEQIYTGVDKQGQYLALVGVRSTKPDAKQNDHTNYHIFRIDPRMLGN